MKSFIVLLFPIFSWADYQLGLAQGSFLGRAQVIGTYVSENEKHETSFSFGYTDDPAIGVIKQYSLVYLWSAFEARKREDKNYAWNPLLIGSFITYTDNKLFYITTDDPYPQDHYYDITSLRWGFRFSSQIQNFIIDNRYYHFSFDGSLMERAIINYFNNMEELDIFKYYFSLGFSIKTSF
jgi:hypothetical protein